MDDAERDYVVGRFESGNLLADGARRGATERCCAPAQLKVLRVAGRARPGAELDPPETGHGRNEGGGARARGPPGEAGRTQTQAFQRCQRWSKSSERTVVEQTGIETSAGALEKTIDRRHVSRVLGVLALGSGVVGGFGKAEAEAESVTADNNRCERRCRRRCEDRDNPRRCRRRCRERRCD